MAAQSWSLFLLALSSFLTTKTVVDAASVELVYQYDGAVWVENLAVRPNGWILPATATSAVLTQLNPANGELQVIHDWSEVGSAIMSITKVQPDVFLANTMYCDLTKLAVRNAQCHSCHTTGRSTPLPTLYLRFGPIRLTVPSS